MQLMCHNSINTPIWYNGESYWAEDNVFMLYQMEVTNPSDLP